MIAFVLRTLLWLMALGSTLMFFVVSGQRLVYPLELDCIEGVMMDHVVRLAHGQPIYVEPSLSFIPLAYMPLFATLASLPARIFGPAFWEPRLLSLLAIIGILILIVRVIRAETESWTLAAGGAAIYLMGFGIAGNCYDVARPDSLMLFLALAGLATLRLSTGQTGAVVSALLMALAFFAKQHASWFILGALIHLALNDRHRLLVFGLWVVVFVGGAFSLLSYWLGSWFAFYTLEIPSRWSQFDGMRLFQMIGQNLLGTFGPIAAVALLSLGLSARPWRGRDGLWMWMGFAALGSAAMATLDPFAYRHVLMPLVLALSILGPISLFRIGSEFTVTRATQVRATMGIMCGVLSLQFLPLVYPVREGLPRARAAEARAAFVADLARQPGTVVVPYHGFYSWLAGKGTSMHIMPLDDVIRAKGNRLLANDPAFFERMFQPLREGTNRPVIVTDVPLAKSGVLWNSLEKSYALTGQLGWLSEPLRPVTGNRFSPSLIYRPASAPVSDVSVAAAADSTLAVARPPAAGAAPHGTSRAIASSTP